MTTRGGDRRPDGWRPSSAIPNWIGAGGLVALIGVAAFDSGGYFDVDRLGLIDILALATVALTLVATFLQFERWRVSATTSALWAAAAGLFATGMVFGRRLLPGFGIEKGLSTLGAASFACTVLILVIAAWMAVDHRLERRLRPPHLLVTLTTSTVLMVAAFEMLDVEMRSRVDPQPGALGRSIFAVAWFVVGALLLLRSRREATTTPAWLAIFCLTVAASDAVGAMHIEHGLNSNPARIGLVLLGSAGLAYASEVDLRRALAEQASELELTRAQYRAVGLHARQAQAAAHERAHEARNALAAIDGAIRTLEKYSDHLPADTRARLSEGLSAEIIRLQRLVDIDETLDEPTSFRVAAVLTPVAMLARTQGLDVRIDIRPDIEAVASRDAVVEAVQNLLVNAQRHAGGHGVVLQAGTDGDRAIIRVLDRGPGVPSDARETIFQRGRPQGETGGRGFGLYLSRKLVEAQGGTLVVEARRGGGAKFEFDLPLATSRLDAPPTLDEGHEIVEAGEPGHP